MSPRWARWRSPTARGGGHPKAVEHPEPGGPASKTFEPSSRFLRGFSERGTCRTQGVSVPLHPGSIPQEREQPVKLLTLGSPFRDLGPCCLIPGDRSLWFVAGGALGDTAHCPLAFRF